MKIILRLFVLAQFLAIISYSAETYSQNYEISFAGTGESNTVDSVFVENITQNTSISLGGSDILNLVGTVGIETPKVVFNEVTIYPNPMNSCSFIEFPVAETGDVVISIYDISGKSLLCKKEYLPKGQHRFELKSLPSGVYCLQIKAKQAFYTAKIHSTSSINGKTELTLVGSGHIDKNSGGLKRTNAVIQMQYNNNDLLKLVGSSGNKRTVRMLIADQSQTLPFLFATCEDLDGNSYMIVEIQSVAKPVSQVWMAENLAATHYNYGVQIPHITDNNEWFSCNSPGYCWFDNDSTTNASNYGALYNWYAVGTGDLCPSGWHLPTDDEWKQLEISLGMSQMSADSMDLRGLNEGSKLAGNAALWNDGLLEFNSEFSTSGFLANPAGSRNNLGTYYQDGTYGRWWCITEYSVTNGYSRRLGFNESRIMRASLHKDTGLSVRCVMD